jgi:hypothetical protein
LHRRYVVVVDQGNLVQPRTIHTCFAYYSPMGGERASTTRMRLSGRICCACKIPLAPDPKHLQGERCCARCASKRTPPTHRVYMSFMKSHGWYCQFLEEDLKTPLPRKLTFVSSEKIMDLAERAGALRNLECRQALERGIEVGRGGLFLTLTEDQYTKLTAKRSQRSR